MATSDNGIRFACSPGVFIRCIFNQFSCERVNEIAMKMKCEKYSQIILHTGTRE